ncbi:MAG: NAD(P)H-dependent oxidoreductase subunit E [Chitinophagales bacterium]|jgi:NADH-quinone oxidoreductase subunit E|nr:NAD(P)H-dependent oxidoreductase subunit E [Chitinophagales bacterium]
MEKIKVNSSPPFSFNEENLLEAKRILAMYPEDRSKSALLRLLHIAQKQNNGFCSVGVMDYIADFLKIKPIEVYEVATFYTMYHLKPLGKHVFEFCQTATCATVGVEKIIDYTCNKLGIGIGETTHDGLFSIKTVECLGACGYAPMMQLGEDYVEHLTESKIDELIQNLRNQENG